MENKNSKGEETLSLLNASFSSKIRVDEEFFDDCLICQAMKAAKEQGREPTEEELKEAFKKAKEQGVIVDGELFEKGSQK